MNNPINFYGNLKLLFLVMGCVLGGAAFIEFFALRILHIARMQLYRSGILKFHPEGEIGKKVISSNNSASLSNDQDFAASDSLSGDTKLRSGSLEHREENKEERIEDGTEETSLLQDNLSQDKLSQDKKDLRSLKASQQNSISEASDATGSEATSLLNQKTHETQDEEKDEEDGSAATSLLTNAMPNPKNLSRDNSQQISESSNSEKLSQNEGSENTTLLTEKPIEDDDGTEDTALLTDANKNDTTPFVSDGTEETALLQNTKPDDRFDIYASHNRAKKVSDEHQTDSDFVIDTEDIITHDSSEREEL